MGFALCECGIITCAAYAYGASARGNLGAAHDVGRSMGRLLARSASSRRTHNSRAPAFPDPRTFPQANFNLHETGPNIYILSCMGSGRRVGVERARESKSGEHMRVKAARAAFALTLREMRHGANEPNSARERTSSGSLASSRRPNPTTLPTPNRTNETCQGNARTALHPPAHIICELQQNAPAPLTLAKRSNLHSLA